MCWGKGRIEFWVEEVPWKHWWLHRSANGLVEESSFLFDWFRICHSWLKDILYLWESLDFPIFLHLQTDQPYSWVPIQIEMMTQVWSWISLHPSLTHSIYFPQRVWIWQFASFLMLAWALSWLQSLLLLYHLHAWLSLLMTMVRDSSFIFFWVTLQQVLKAFQLNSLLLEECNLMVKSCWSWRPFALGLLMEMPLFVLLLVKLHNYF